MKLDQYRNASREELMEALCHALEREQAALEREGEALRLALTDRLTGVGNQHSLPHASQRMFNRIRRSRQPLIVLYFDLNTFKVYNNVYGHKAGDAVLQALGAELKQMFRDDDAVVRLGGDEFLVVAELNRTKTVKELCRFMALLATRAYSELGANVDSRIKETCRYLGHGLGISLVIPSPNHGGRSYVFKAAWGADGLIPNAEWNGRSFSRKPFRLDDQDLQTEDMLRVCQEGADEQMYRSKRSS